MKVMTHGRTIHVVYSQLIYVTSPKTTFFKFVAGNIYTNPPEIPHTSWKEPTFSAPFPQATRQYVGTWDPSTHGRWAHSKEVDQEGGTSQGNPLCAIPIVYDNLML